MGVVWPIEKHWESLFAAKGIIQSSIMTCSKRDHLLQPTGRCHITLSPVKNLPPCDATFHRNSLTTCLQASSRLILTYPQI